jgi:transposase InsO family protein
MKDDATHYTRLVPADSYTSDVAVEAIIQWTADFGTPQCWVSDSGTHFKNQVLTKLSKQLQAEQDIIVAYSPWINGSIERVNRDILQVMRVMIKELKLNVNEWPYLVPAVPHNLNHTPMQSLGNIPIIIL